MFCLYLPLDQKKKADPGDPFHPVATTLFWVTSRPPLLAEAIVLSAWGFSVASSVLSFGLARWL